MASPIRPVLDAGSHGLSLVRPKNESGLRWPEIQEQRLQQIRDICQQVQGNFEEEESLPPGALRDTLIDAEEKVMVCPNLLDPLQKTSRWEPVVKLAAHESLRWRHRKKIPGVKFISEEDLTRILTGETVPGRKQDRDLSGLSPSTAWMKKHTKILFVEHPFEKLASIFRERIRDRNGYLGYEIGKKILGFSRGFSNLTSQVLEKGQIDFREMTSFILKRDVWDPHWKTLFEVCHPCDIQYDYVIKAETMLDDVKGLIRQWYPSGKKRRKAMKPFEDELVETEEDDVMDMMSKHYTGINAFDMLMLYDLYSIDMFMFDYSWPFDRLSL